MSSLRMRVLLPLIATLLVAVPAAAQSPQPSNPAPKPATPAARAAPTPSGPLLDINSASVEELQALPQIGPARAEAIVKGRPYRSKSDLVDRKIIPQNAYQAIRARVIAHQKS